MDKAQLIRQRIHKQNQKLQLAKNLSFRSLNSSASGKSVDGTKGASRNLLKNKNNGVVNENLDLLNTPGKTPDQSPALLNTPSKSSEPSSIKSPDLSPDAQSERRKSSVGDMFRQKTQTYMDLFKHSTIRRPLFALLFRLGIKLEML